MLSFFEWPYSSYNSNPFSKSSFVNILRNVGSLPYMRCAWDILQYENNCSIERPLSWKCFFFGSNQSIVIDGHSFHFLLSLMYWNIAMIRIYKIMYFDWSKEMQIILFRILRKPSCTIDVKSMNVQYYRVLLHHKKRIFCNSNCNHLLQKTTKIYHGRIFNICGKRI